MDILTILSLGQTALELGLICSLTVLALFLSYTMLNVCDLSTDGCFTLGAAVGAAVALAGHPWLSLGAAMAAGICSGFIVAILQTRMGVNSLLAGISCAIAPLFAPLGFADWRVSTALITGFMAKESVVSTLLILFGSTAALSAALTPAQAAPLLVFCLLYTPCIAAVAAVKRELGGKWATIMVVNQCVVAWVCALLVRLVAVMLF